MEKFLLIDGSLSPCRVALGRGSGKVLEIRPPGWPLDGIFSAVEEILREANFLWDDISAIVACAGPGNLTGLRAAKMLVDVAQSLGFGHPVFSFNGLELAAKWILQSTTLKNFSIGAPVSKQRSVTISAIEGVLGDVSFAKNYEHAALAEHFTLETGFALPRERPAPTVPVEFILQNLQSMAEAHTFDLIAFRGVPFAATANR